MSQRNPGATAESIAEYFRYDHLPPALQEVSKPFGDLAVALLSIVPDCAERTEAMRKLVESKDCAVRAKLYNKKAPAPEPQPEPEPEAETP